MPMTLPTTRAVHVQNPRTRDDSDDEGSVMSPTLLNQLDIPLRCATSEHVGQRLTCIRFGLCFRVLAMLLAGRWRPIGKHMSQVTSATCAHLFHPGHAVARITQALDVRLIVGTEKARPAGARVELGVGAEERQTTEAACVDAIFLVIQKDAAEGSFGAVLEQYAALAAVESRGDLATLRFRRRCQIESAHDDSLEFSRDIAPTPSIVPLTRLDMSPAWPQWENAMENKNNVDERFAAGVR